MSKFNNSLNVKQNTAVNRTRLNDLHLVSRFRPIQFEGIVLHVRAARDAAGDPPAVAWRPDAAAIEPREIDCRHTEPTDPCPFAEIGRLLQFAVNRAAASREDDASGLPPLRVAGKKD